MSKSNKVNNPGLANSSSWNDSPFAFAPNTNVLDAESMPSEQAQLAREKSAQIMAALNSGDVNKANALMGKSETPGHYLPGMGRLKKKLNARKGGPALEGQSVEEEEEKPKSTGFWGKRKGSATEKA